MASAMVIPTNTDFVQRQVAAVIQSSPGTRVFNFEDAMVVNGKSGTVSGATHYEFDTVSIGIPIPSAARIAYNGINLDIPLMHLPLPGDTRSFTTHYKLGSDVSVLLYTSFVFTGIGIGYFITIDFTHCSTNSAFSCSAFPSLTVTA